MEMAATGIETVSGLGRAPVEARLAYLTKKIGEKAVSLGNKIALSDPRFRAPQLICLGFPDGMPDGLAQRLAAEKVYVAPRIGRLRVSPHVYNDEEDIERLVAGLAKALG
jgi:selenocysteine lyase/cysteine desulfurase